MNRSSGFIIKEGTLGSLAAVLGLDMHMKGLFM